MNSMLKITGLAGLTAALLSPLAVAPAAQAQAAGLPYTAEASSDRGSYFNINQIRDGNLTSAWGPHVDDLMPNLTLNMGRNVQVAAMEIKLSPVGATVAVEMSTNGTWRTIASGIRPQAETLARVSLPLTTGDRLRLKFSGVSAGQLLVCEVRVFGENAGTVTNPTPAPTAYPTTQPTPVPGSNVNPGTGTCFAATGGGWIPSAKAGWHGETQNNFKNNNGKGNKDDKGHKGNKNKDKEDKKNKGNGRGHGHDDHHDDRGNRHKATPATPAKVTFGFNAKERTGRSDHGNVQLTDHGSGHKFHGTVTQVSGQGNTVTFSGSLKSGGTFTAVVTDNGEPGRNDRIRFSTSTGYWADGQLGGGNIQVRRGDCR